MSLSRTYLVEINNYLKPMIFDAMHSNNFL